MVDDLMSSGSREIRKILAVEFVGKNWHLYSRRKAMSMPPISWGGGEGWQSRCKRVLVSRW